MFQWGGRGCWLDSGKEQKALCPALSQLSTSGAVTDSVESGRKERHLDDGLALRVNISVEPHLCPGLLHGHSVLCDSHHDADSI